MCYHFFTVSLLLSMVLYSVSLCVYCVVSGGRPLPWQAHLPCIHSSCVYQHDVSVVFVCCCVCVLLLLLLCLFAVLLLAD